MQELEAKYLVEGGDADRALRRLQQSLAWAGYRIQPAGRRDVLDTYFDTADGRLRDAGWSYRQRRENGHLSLTLKELNRSRAGVFDRNEIEQAVTDGAASTQAALPPAGPVRDCLAELLPPGVRVEPLFTLSNRRTRYRLTHPDHPDARVEMAFDRARAEGAEAAAFTEIELELAQGPHEALAGLLDVAALEPQLVPARLSKFQRGLMAAGRPLDEARNARAGHLDPTDRWLDLAVFHLKAQLAAMRRYEPYAWEGVHPEGVHQMRVATRRARAALDVFADVLPTSETARLAADLKRLAARLGAVRDLDVHLTHLERYEGRIRPAEAPVLDAYRTHLENSRREARARLLDALADDAYTRLIADFRALLSAAGRNGQATDVRIAAAARTTVPPLLDAVRRRGRKLGPDSPAKQLHRLRIEVKHLRYPVEFLEDVYGDPMTGALTALGRLQTRLGTLQDAVVAHAELAAYRKAYARNKAERRLFERLMDDEQARGRKARKRFRRDWRRLERATRGLIGRL